MTTTRLTWEQFREQLARLSYLPGYERLGEAHFAEYYMLLRGYWPHEVYLAITAHLKSPSTEFFPPPGKIIARMQEHRSQIGGNDWASTERALIREADKYAGHIEPPRIE